MPDISKQIVAEDEDMARVREEGLGELTPKAQEPLKPKVVNALGDVIVQTASALAPNGELGELQVEKVSGPVDQLPASIASKVMMFSRFAADMAASGMTELEPYQFEPGPMMTTNAGLDEIQAIIGGMGSDPEVVKAMRAPPPTGQEGAEQGMMEQSEQGEEV